HFGELAAGETLSAAQHRELAQAAAARGGFDDGIEGTLVGVAEDREQRGALALIDRIIPPFAACDLAAVERQQLLELGACEEDCLVSAPVIVQTKECRHRPPRKKLVMGSPQ